MPIRKQPRRRQHLAQRIFTYNGVVVDSPDVNHATNIGRNKVECSCGSVVLRGGYSYHIQRKTCVDYHELINGEPEIIQYLP